ncbi:MAG: hypothetical protein ACI4JB_01315 [Porcipelethomonas sp.]
MSTAECRRKAASILKGCYGEGIFVVMVCITVYMIVKIADVFSAGFILFNSGGASGLFMTCSLWEGAAKLLLWVTGFAVMTPLLTGGLWWFYQTACGEDNRSILKLYTGFRLNLRAACLYAVMWLMGMLSLLPSGICWGAAVYVFRMIPGHTEQGVMLFAVLQLFMAGLFLLGLYLKCMTSMALAPFIFLRNPDRNIFGILHMSRKIIYGSKLECLKLVLTYIPAMLPVVTIPFVLPRAVMAVAVFARDRIGGVQWEK